MLPLLKPEKWDTMNLSNPQEGLIYIEWIMNNEAGGYKECNEYKNGI